MARPADDRSGDIRATIPRFTAENRAANQALLAHVADLAAKSANPNTAAARIGVHGNRYNDLHMGLVGR